jgi:hypothetical protein
MRLKVPLVIRFHGSDTFCHLENRKQNGKFCLKVKGKRATSIYCLTDYAGKVSKELFSIQIKDTNHSLYWHLRI